MYSATTPEKLLELCIQLKHKGALGCLVSGGCLPDGSVPLGKFINIIRKVKRESGLTVIVHTGIVDFDTAEGLRTAGVDAALIDIIGSDETIREIYKLNTTVKAYEDSLRALHKAGIAFVPHVIVGLHYGKLKGELYALKMISKYKPSALVIIAFMPIHDSISNRRSNTIHRKTRLRHSFFFTLLFANLHRHGNLETSEEQMLPTSFMFVVFLFSEAVHSLDISDCTFSLFSKTFLNLFWLLFRRC